MACEDIERRLRDLRRRKRELESVIDNLHGAGANVAQENLANINARIATEERNLTACRAAASGSSTTPSNGLTTPGNASTRASFVGYVGTIESETRNVSRLWISLTSDETGKNWVKEAGKRVWLTMNMESSYRPSHMAQLTLLLEAMRSGLAVKLSHDGVATGFHKRVRGDSYEVDGVRILRTGLGF